MTCCILEKSITTTVIPGSPGVPATPGSPAKPAYCATAPVNVCEWVLNPAVTWVNGQPYVNGLPLLNAGVQLSIFTCHTVNQTTCYPAQAAVPGSPGLPPTPSQIITSKNVGWNSHSRAINPLAVDSMLTFSVAAGVHAVFVGLGPADMDGSPLNAFDYGMMLDASGVHVFENGSQGIQLATGFNSGTIFQIVRNGDGEIIYIVDEDEEHTSATEADNGDTLYPYVYMYSGGDRVLCASYSSLTAYPVLDVTLPAVQAVLMESGVTYAAISASLGGATCEMEAYEIEACEIGSDLPALESVLGEAGVSYAFIKAYLPTVSADMAEAGYVPPTLTELYANLQPLACVMFCQTIEICDIDTSLPAIQGVMGEGNYAFINDSLPALAGSMSEGVRLDMWMLDGMVASAPITMALELVLTIMSTGDVASVQAFELVIDQEYMSDIDASSILSMLGEYGLEYMSDLSVQSVQLMELPTGAALNGLARVWVVNLDTNAASQYDGYAFNSFFTRAGQQYGVADDGIYLLEGDDDAGLDIDAIVELGLSDLGDSRHKSVPSIYLGVASTGRMVVKVAADGATHYYEARSSSADLKTHRVEPGRGLRAVNWSFSVLNQDGGDFDLASIEFLPLVTKRRI